MRTLSICSEQLPAVPSECCCFLSDIISEECRLRKRHSELSTKRSRILELSEPRVRTPKRQTACVNSDVKMRTPRIVRLEQSTHTRTDQLSYPKERESFRSFNKARKDGVNRLLRKSLDSLYSRLSNTQLEPPPLPKMKFNNYEWDELIRRLSNLAEPKKCPKVNNMTTDTTKVKETGKGKKSKSYKQGKALRRFTKLARPKQYEEDSGKEWRLTDQLRSFTPSKRLLSISKPKLYTEVEAGEIFRVKRSALRYKATPRIEEMATPPKVWVKSEAEISVLRVNPNALNGKIPSRINELAVPKTWSDPNTRANPYAVSRNALKAKPTKRLNELAQPKTITIAFRPKIIAEVKNLCTRLRGAPME